MKRYLILLLVIISISSYAQVTTNVFPGSGNVGIGTTNPQFSLEIDKVFSDSNYLNTPVQINATQNVATNVISSLMVNTKIAHTSGNITGALGLPVYCTYSGSGTVGIIRSFQGFVLITGSGTINEAACFTGAIGSVATATVNNAYGLYINRFPNNIINKYGVYINDTSAKNYFGGYVGIGTTTPKEALSVNGNVRAKEVKVEAANWPDYVFRPSYNLPPLSQIENFIKQNGHLPGVPAAKEVAEKGIEVGANQAVLLKKIEELTLHLIEMEKTINVLKKENKEIRIQLAKK
ncbi:MAG: hypothetical protein J7539_17790 [Niabella sp.]|nr:hypothetical protein [Niabella sp.]